MFHCSLVGDSRGAPVRLLQLSRSDGTAGAEAEAGAASLEATPPPPSAAGPRSPRSPRMGPWLTAFHPAAVFLAFLSRAVFFDHTVLLDFLISDETSFLAYLTRFVVCLHHLLLVLLDV